MRRLSVEKILKVKIITLILLSTAMCLWTPNKAESRIVPGSYSHFESFGNLCWDDEKARLDAFATTLQRSPDSIGYVYVYAGKHSCSGEAKYRAGRAEAWLRKRGVNSTRLFVKDAGYREAVETELIVASVSQEKPPLRPSLEKKEISVRRKCVDKIFARVICLNKN